MADRPIIFSAPMIRALLEGRKSQTRRILPKAHPKFPHHCNIRTDVLCFDPAAPEVWYWDGEHDRVGASYRLRYAIGDRLWVREAWRSNSMRPDDVIYRADGESLMPWRSPIHMPRWASRLTLTVTDVRVQRVQEISDADARAEGVQPFGPVYSVQKANGLTGCGTSARAAYAILWNNIHGPGAWDANPWVCAISFTVHRCNIDQMVPA